MGILAGFIMGLAGSFHCIGMCGPIALALPVENSSLPKMIIQRLLYNFGRIISYSFIGFVLGYLGEKIKLFGFQQVLSVFLGLLILISLLIPMKFKGKLLFSKIYNLYNSYIKSRFMLLLKNKSSYSLLVIGILNGFLPCGFVYMALAGALTAGSIPASMFFMAAFGFGTLPAMFVTSMAGGFISLNIRRKISRLAPAFILLFAVLFILRGLNLGIPFISPKTVQNTIHSTEVDCCH